MTFFEFCGIVRGYYIVKNNKTIPKYCLYWNNIDPEKIKLGLTDYKLVKR